MKKSTTMVTISTLAFLILAGGARAGGFHYGDCPPGAGPGIRTGLGTIEPLTPRERRLLRERDREKRRQARELKQAHRRELQTLRKKIVSSRRELRRTLRFGPWDETTVRQRAQALGDAIADMIVGGTRLRRDMGRLMTPPVEPVDPPSEKQSPAQ